jgi:glycosyltransferase involved in cell wall biosynthesis
MFRKKLHYPNHAPLVSYVIPVFDRTDVLRDAINSVLSQSYQNLEILIVSDGSPAETLNVLQEFEGIANIRIFYFSNSSGNAVRGRNKGILEARGKYIAFLDSDDLCDIDRTTISVKTLENDDCDVVYGGYRVIIDSTRYIDGLFDSQEIYSPNCDLSLLKQICVPCQSSVTVRRDHLLRAGFLKNSMKYREDHELWLRLAEFGSRFKAIPEILVSLRIHAGNNELNFKDHDSFWEKRALETYKIPGPRFLRIFFIMESLRMSGGSIVILKHIRELINEGHSVTIVLIGDDSDYSWFGTLDIELVNFWRHSPYELANIDILISTFWTTAKFLKEIHSNRKIYFVQSDERNFYEDQHTKDLVEKTYRLNVEYIVISEWLKDLFETEFKNKNVTLVNNGIDLRIFKPRVNPSPDLHNPLRVLIEGPVSVEFKGVKKAYQALRSSSYELWLVNSDGLMPQAWSVGQSFFRVSEQDMANIYQQCDVLLKLSSVESFCYPAIEAMASGCLVIISKVKGGIDYIRNNVNALVLDNGSKQEILSKLEQIQFDPELARRLRENGYITSQKYTLEKSSEEFLNALGLKRVRQ